MFLIGVGYLGMLSFFLLDFVMTHTKPWPASMSDVNPALAYASGTIMIIAIAMIFMNKFQLASLIVVFNLIFWLATSRHINALWEDKVNSYKSLVFLCGTILVYYPHIKSASLKKYLLWLCLSIVCLFFEYCAIGHFVAAKFVQLLIPEYIPYRLFFTYFAGICLALAGIGLLIPRLQKITALLSGIQITGWFILLHIPRAIAIGDRTWIGVGESFALAGICFMIYGVVKEKPYNKIQSIPSDSQAITSETSTRLSKR